MGERDGEKRALRNWVINGIWVCKTSIVYYIYYLYNYPTY